MGSSHYVFFFPRVHLNFHVAQTLVWLVGVRSPRSDGARQRAFNRTQCNSMSVLSLSVNMVFTKLFVLLSGFVCRDMSLRSTCQSARMDPTTELIDVAVLIASWHAHREDTSRLFATTSARHLRCNVAWSQPGALHGQRNKQATHCVDTASAARFGLTPMHSNAT